ncbi:thymocyte nuclear protein 1-like [Orbicella faveolata]|uniref:thymocyte nuclear protein 1-like n=1 Tax=Orbicella faveolata TaxID=48498 RepID=UPI0009E21E61|nr:thymocyte nuclear protein 1-like [Orbicella faveolata]
MPPKKKRKVESSKPTKETKQENQSANRSKTQKQDAKQAVQYTRWLMKSEPESRIEKGVDVKFGIEDLKNEPDQTTCWDGVRNYQARNFMRDQMKNGQLAFFYHSNCKPPGIAGIVEIVKESYVDYTQFDKADPHYDPGAKKDNPKWFMVDVKFVRMMKRFISLQELKTLHQNHKSSGGPLKSLSLFTSARLSVQPVTEEEFEFICSLEDKPEGDTS